MTMGNTQSSAYEREQIENLMEILSKVAVLCRDNGESFTDTTRLDAVAALLWDSRYRRINADGLFHLYAKKTLGELHGPLCIVSTHVDCENGITRCFTQKQGDGTLKGTYDNAITNAVILYIMLHCDLPDDILIAFTGDEEYGANGAKDLMRFLHSKRIVARNTYVLDVSNVGWREGLDFTIENDLWDDTFGRSVIDLAAASGRCWMFVPSDLSDVPEYVDRDHVVWEEAAEDETWEYDEEGIPSFSFCIPVLGDMHSNAGVLVRESSLIRYTNMLADMLMKLH